MVAAADFTIAGLLTDTGVSRAQFRRCFAGKKQMLAALTQGDVKALGDILEVAPPVEVLRAVGSDITPAAPITDAWLERRLRVFERALGGLEKRQEKSEQTLGQRLALMEEKLAGLAQAKPVAAPEPALPLFDPSEFNLLPAEGTTAHPAASAPVASAQTLADAAPGEAASLELAPNVLAHVEQIAKSGPAEEPVSEKEMADFIAHARQVARRAVPPPAKPRRRRGPVWNGLVLASILIGGLMLIGAALLLASGVPQASPVASVSHRQTAQTGMARIMALADSGDARAQTLLALAYLRGPAANAGAARRWSIAAASQGQPVAQYLLGTLYLDSDPAQAVRWLRAAAEQGNVKAMHNLAIAFAQGPAPDPALAVQWFTRAAAKGYRDSQFDLAVLYERGLGVPQSGAEALKWYLIAAGGGDAPSAGRAAVLKDQIGADDVRMAKAEAAGFVPQPAASAANQIPEL